MNKSTLLPLNTAMSNLHLDVLIPMAPHFRYLGIDIYSSIDKIVSINYKRLKKAISDELLRWSSLLIRLATRISVVKTHILPKVIFYVSMIHLHPTTWILGEDTGSDFHIHMTGPTSEN